MMQEKTERSGGIGRRRWSWQGKGKRTGKLLYEASGITARNRVSRSIKQGYYERRFTERKTDMGINGESDSYRGDANHGPQRETLLRNTTLGNYVKPG